MKRLVICSVAVGCLVTSALAGDRELTFDQRVAFQRAIEQVYWNHRIWPKENPGAKPPLSAVMSDDAIRAKVEDYLKKANALGKWWGRPITAEQLQAEIDRMAMHTRDGRILRELFQALGSDPNVIAETLARETLADRLVHNYFTNDERFHGELKKRAAASLAACRAADCMKSLGGDYRERVWKLRNDPTDSPEAGTTDDSVRLDVDDWNSKLSQLARHVGGTQESLILRKISGLEETPEAFVVTSVLGQRRGEVTTATVVWPKTTFDTWWAMQRATLDTRVTPVSGTFVVPVVADTVCVDDTWTPTFVFPVPRQDHTAVWTGTEMIIWGGTADGRTPLLTPTGRLNTGGRYNPSTDSWEVTSMGNNVPSPRALHSAVWTGTEMIVWGGTGSQDGRTTLNTGGRYSPSTDSWVGVSTAANRPDPREEHTAIWTGSEMIVWGGTSVDRTVNDFRALNTGGRYRPATDTWTATSAASNVPESRHNHTAVWTGSEMIVWGGSGDGGYLNSGGRYSPVADTWVPTSTGANVPLGRQHHTAVWTGTEVIVWGGDAGYYFPYNSGGRYDPSTDAWAQTSMAAEVPDPRSHHTAVWTGTEMIVWGGSQPQIGYNSGGRYDPSSDTWVATSMGPNVPEKRQSHAAIWTGSEMIVWGGSGSAGVANDGGRYSPATDSWVATSTGSNVPSRREHNSILWTGTEMIVWGGDSEMGLEKTGGRYNPSTDSWSATSTGDNVPSARAFPAIVWTGTEMIIWGDDLYGTGGLYNPSSDSWAPTSMGPNVPEPRSYPSAVWTGTEMIVWGGISSVRCCSDFLLNTGGLYNPTARACSISTGTPCSHSGDCPNGETCESGTWTPTSMGVYVPAGRYLHTAVWTGTEMIIWGGWAPGSLNTGGRYNPSATACNPTGSPCGSSLDCPDGGSCEAGSWTPTPMGANVPTRRAYHTAVWTGTEMIVWGGEQPGESGPVNTGGRYRPYAGACSVSTGIPCLSTEDCPDGESCETDTWTPTSTGANVPDARGNHSAVWTGTEMIVWGGSAPLLNTGGRYAPTSDTWTPTATGANVPAPRNDHTAVWTGTEMIVWGGWELTGGYGYWDSVGVDGGRYCVAACAMATTSYRDADGDGYGDPSVSVKTCDGSVPAGYVSNATDCDDTNMFAHPGAIEICNGVDDNCNGQIDEGYVSQPSSCGTGACARTGTTSCVGGSVLNNCVAGQPTAETCNGIDDDCNGVVDDGGASALCDDGDACTVGDTCQLGACVSGTPVVCTALDQCHTAGTCDTGTGACSNPPKLDGASCSDGDACTHADTCQAGVCSGGNPVICAAADQCHVVGTCNPGTGICSNPAAADGTTCNDGNPCTAGDACNGGTCAGTAITPPPETLNVRVAADKTTYSWSSATYATQYDVVRGSTGAFPVGPGGGDEVCFDNLAGPSLTDSTVPAAGTGFWYLSRGENACGIGTYGTRSNGSPRTTTTCP